MHVIDLNALEVYAMENSHETMVGRVSAEKYSKQCHQKV